MEAGAGGLIEFLSPAGSRGRTVAFYGEDEVEVLEMYLQMVSAPAAFPEVPTVVVSLEYVWPIGPVMLVVVVYETAVVIVSFTVCVELPLTERAVKTRYWKAPQ